jgi:hypothetical protein
MRRPVLPARIFLVEPLHQDHVGDARDVACPIAGLRLVAQRLVAIEDRLDVLRRDRDDPLLAAVEDEVGAHQGHIPIG